MAKSFREIVSDEDALMELLHIADTRAIDGDGVVSLRDFDDICAKIATINTVNPKTYSRRIAWTLISRLLLGLTSYLDICVQNCFEESLKLNQQLGSNLVMVKSKRKTLLVESQKAKKQRITIVAKETTNVDWNRLWEEPLELDSEELTQPDLTLVSIDKITLREIEPPTVSSGLIDIHDSIGFDGSGDVIFDSHLEPFDDGSFGANMIVTCRSFDENMNDITIQSAFEDTISTLAALGKSPKSLVLPNSPASSNLSAPQSPVQKLTVNDRRRTENPLSVLKSTPFAPPNIAALAKKGKCRKVTIFKDEDDEKIIAGDVMKKRISNTTASCKARKSDLFTKEKLQKLKLNDMFTAPAIRGTPNQKLFARSAKTRLVIEVDWTTIQDAFDSGIRDDNGTKLSEEIDILQNENGNISRRTRSQSRMSMSFNGPMLNPVLSSTPINPSQKSVHSFHASHPNNVVPNDISPIDSYTDLFEPPSPFMDIAALAPPGFKNDSQNHESNKQPQSSIPHLDDHNVPEIDVAQNSSPLIECSDLLVLLGENSLEYTMMQKLIKLWQKGIHPIKVDDLLAKKCNRFQAAKTFASLLNLKKKKLVQLENSADGKIEHISKGDDFVLIVEPEHSL
ncbi:uncharacterized protein LOC116337117 [Contarinia nasturtii]|uniref:uncharacterized protein LOC116337117 n=1 Tax=Contarinia nasturtii TaxID=265458 RepID=UPI0012D38CD8|nr:uncharacterized protein LOC116337117 [Contarinia nasturtii]